MAKPKQDLKTFKASDAQKVPLSAGKKKKGQPAAGDESTGAGFPTIERLLEQEKLDWSGPEQRLEALRALAEAGNARDKGAVRKAIAAYERTQDLLEFLWQTKSGLAGPAPK
ncbi:MAG: hypothetical protein JXR83_10695 [Deltaproteobacteria bacterium]|nr:hypothetical protein [Deltaproteobacteria bacterium]